MVEKKSKKVNVGSHKRNSPTKKLTKAPKGWKKTIGASTAPRGYEWYSNGESRFSGKRKIALVKRKSKR